MITLLNSGFKYPISKAIVNEKMLTATSELRVESPEHFIEVDYYCIKKIEKQRKPIPAIQ